jgi:hypothetical protein
MADARQSLSSEPAKVIPITAWPFYFMRKIERQIAAALSVPAHMMKEPRNGR